LMLLGLVILGAAYAGWYQLTERRAAKVETVPPIPERLAPAAPHTAAPSPQVASLLPATAPPSPEPGGAGKLVPGATPTGAVTAPAPATQAKPAPMNQGGVNQGGAGSAPTPPVTVAPAPAAQ